MALWNVPVHPFASHHIKRSINVGIFLLVLKFVASAGDEGRKIQPDTSWHSARWKYEILCPFVRFKRGKVVKQWQVSVLLRVMWQSLPVFGLELRFPHIPRASLSAVLEPTKESAEWSDLFRTEKETLAGCIATVQKGTFVWGGKMHKSHSLLFVRSVFVFFHRTCRVCAFVFASSSIVCAYSHHSPWQSHNNRGSSRMRHSKSLGVKTL